MKLIKKYLLFSNKQYVVLKYIPIINMIFVYIIEYEYRRGTRFWEACFSKRFHTLHFVK